MALIGPTTVAISPELAARSVVSAVLARLDDTPVPAEASGLLDVVTRGSA